MPKVCRTSGSKISNIVSISTVAEVSIQLSRHKRTGSSLVPHIESVGRPVVIFPAAKDISTAAGEIVIVLVTAIVVTQGDIWDISVAVGVIMVLVISIAIVW